ncbi:sensor histidine kinase [Actinopolymorpha singaporensis]|uniref:histidine kinase n=1 Tax=Actinopolymorpha singaporensis TaxID=117157 RepID=A0A1H1LY58_9ACTN|nr:sensor histidine kinase [Actinopolymorpha singaporensis]SDR79534.1 Signal transduction histidine kinase [Actinopolymorpha singaporensis]
MTSTVPDLARRAPTEIGRRGYWHRLGIRSVYVLVGFPLAIVRFVVLLVLFLLGVGTTVTFLGLPVLAGTMKVARGFAAVDRARLSWVQGWPARRPPYVGGNPHTRVGRMLAPLRQAQSWADWGHGLLGIFPAVLGFGFTLVWWAGTLAGLTSFVYIWILDRTIGYEGLGTLLRLGDAWQIDAALSTAAGLIFALTLPAVVRGCAEIDAALARAMLTSDRVAELHGQVSDLTESRDAAVSAEAQALRRLERDIHDGPQQRLVRLAMDLSSAQRRLAKDPATVQPMLAEAITATRETLEELRALSRGIAPPILADRGLRAALAAVAGRSTVPVDLDVDVPDGEHLPLMVENTAYFLVAEALTNVAKHSAATQCTVEVRRTGTHVRVIVTDNGVGGAHTAKGHGLAGLTERVRGVGGLLAVTSPVGGPTVLTAELPWKNSQNA